ncbi:helix-turn-helix domain-containing protein [Bacillus massiliglaciei]|uniref:helix-turn-helix domain-containing protein n=1 Tax=Bacillus massiliglaciei TaxID=1816693 RepID=UPI000ABF5F33|nr:helix-turn-helix domain-containing protein [Bacillus massiliglaciei]
MVKYSKETKLRIVREYLSGSLSYHQLAQKYGIPNRTSIQNWVRSYKEYGEAGIERKRGKQVYSVQFKRTVLHFMKQTEASYYDTAMEFNLNNPSLIANWRRKFLDEGIEGLEEKRKGRLPMSKKPKLNGSKRGTESREERLERENELLRLEVAYLKKLNVFQENPDAFLEKHRQRWHSNSAKKDSD